RARAEARRAAIGVEFPHRREAVLVVAHLHPVQLVLRAGCEDEPSRRILDVHAEIVLAVSLAGRRDRAPGLGLEGCREEKRDDGELHFASIFMRAAVGVAGGVAHRYSSDISPICRPANVSRSPARDSRTAPKPVVAAIHVTITAATRKTMTTGPIQPVSAAAAQRPSR